MMLVKKMGVLSVFLVCVCVCVVVVYVCVL